MRPKLMPIRQDITLERLLAGLATELAEASDEEIVQAAEDLGMNVKMKGSAAFLGVYGLPRCVEDFFEVEDIHGSHIELMYGKRFLSSESDEGTDDEK